MEIERKGICGPIVSLATFITEENNGQEVILWSIGGVLFWFHPSTLQKSLVLFDYANVHGIMPFRHSGLVIVFGDKALCLLSYVSSDNLFQIVAKTQSLDDMVLDAQIISSNNSVFVLAVGYAHNFYDLIELSGTCQFKTLQRVQCSEKFALFSISLSIYSAEDILVASGSLFGKITLWKSTKDVSNEVFSSKILGSIQKHEGVIFRIVWNESRSKLITVSDDRTARVWSLVRNNDDSISIQPVMVCWGHVCRLWDAIFLDETEETIATCSEDSTIKIWNQQSETISTFKGHLGSVWRVMKMKTKDLFVSCSNDSSIKFWNLQFQLTNSPEQESSTLSNSLIPSWPVDLPTAVNDETGNDNNSVVNVKRREKSNKRNNGVSSLRISPCGNYIFLILVSGQIWIVRLNSKSIGSSFAVEEWIPFLDLGRNILLSDIHFDYDSSNDQLHTSGAIHLSFLIGFVDCSCVYFESSFPNGQQPEQQQQSFVMNYRSTRFEWKPHEQKPVNVWFCENYSDESLVFYLNDVRSRMFMTTSLKGICKLWKYERTGHSNEIHLMRVFETERCEIASSFLYKTATEFRNGYYIIGDSRGGINLFLDNNVMKNFDSEELDSEDSKEEESPSAPEKPFVYFNKIHATDPVSKIISTDKGFITVGHDSTMNYFEEFHTVSTSQERVFWWQLMNTALTLPVHTCDNIHLVYGNDETQDDNSNKIRRIESSSIYLSGFHGSSFLIYDIRRNYQLMRIEGGGWKRPHDSQVIVPKGVSGGENSQQLPMSIFACPAPVGKTETELQIFGSVLPVTTSDNHRDRRYDSYPLQLGCCGFGKVSYCSVVIQYTMSQETITWLAVAGEDCTMKVFTYPSLQLLQETTLSKNSSLKAMATTSFSNNNSRGIVLGGGGKLLYYIWLYDFNHYLSNVSSSSTSSSESFVPLQKLYVGNITPDASQDHRIMAVDILFLNYYSQVSLPVKSIENCTANENNNSQAFETFQTDIYQFLLLLSDSRGFITIIDFQYYDFQENYLSFQQYERNWNKKPFTVVQQMMEISSSPVLSCCCLELPMETRGATLEKANLKMWSTKEGEAVNTQSEGKEEISVAQEDQYRFILIAGGDSRGVVSVLLLPIQRQQSSDFRSMDQQENIQNPFIR
jgi:hypothetical protein